jgi:hypothetical protein
LQTSEQLRVPPALTYAAGTRADAEAHTRSLLCPSELVATMQADLDWPAPAFADALPVLFVLLMSPLTWNVVARPLSAPPSHVNVTFPLPPVALIEGRCGGP